MRLWSLHPKYLDTRGLVAVWREGLLAQQVLLGRTLGYRHHPQLARFRAARDPAAALGAYLLLVLREAERRSYAFDIGRIHRAGTRTRLPVTRGQLDYELVHLRRKLWIRDRRAHARCRALTRVEPHPLFVVHQGPIEPWEMRR